MRETLNQRMERMGFDPRSKEDRYLFRITYLGGKVRAPRKAPPALKIGDFVESTTGDFKGFIEKQEYDPRGPYYYVRRTWDRYTPEQRSVRGISTNVGQIIGTLGAGLRRIRSSRVRRSR